MEASRPKRGLPLEAALERWSDPVLYAQMKTYSDASQHVSMASGVPPSPRVLRHQAYMAAREPLEEAQIERLRDGILLVSAISEYGTSREVIDPELFGFLEIDYFLEEIAGPSRKYIEPEFFEPSAIPLNIRDIPAWLRMRNAASFKPDADYQHVEANGLKFAFGPLCAKVIELLHQAALRGEPWQNGPKLLRDAGSKQKKMHDVFKSVKDWKKLVESDSRGRYRLRSDIAL